MRFALALGVVLSLVVAAEAGPFRHRRAPVCYQSSPSCASCPPAAGFTTCSGPSCSAPACSGPSCPARLPSSLVSADSGVVVGTPGLSVAGDALDQVNAQRARRGLPPFVRDEGLTRAAQAAASYRAANLMFGHTANDFQFLPPGAQAAAAGCAAYPASYGFMACCTYESYRFAGAASVVGSDGRTYHHLFVK
jgi:hypothetical protein